MPNYSSEQIKMLALLSDDNRRAFMAKCDEGDAELLVGIVNDWDAGGLDVAQAEARVNEHCDSKRSNATRWQTIGFGGGATIGAGALVAVGTEATAKTLAHPGVIMAMDVSAASVAVALVVTGMAATVQLRKLRSQRNVLRSCARNLVRGR